MAACWGLRLDLRGLRRTDLRICIYFRTDIKVRVVWDFCFFCFVAPLTGWWETRRCCLVCVVALGLRKAVPDAAPAASDALTARAAAAATVHTAPTKTVCVIRRPRARPNPWPITGPQGAQTCVHYRLLLFRHYIKSLLLEVLFLIIL